eukprot:TRINITY_DN5050_c0_g2_i1.p1 TRINITY_DN5050_c0_g2~~TRINITY_DN5050_c0_g2_i1.p1  ORF type:complete len:710 (+),score=226.12 TRINITY_DN5050_c0_g2_i1:1-2130(+)
METHRTRSKTVGNSQKSNYPWYIEESKFRDYKSKQIDPVNLTTVVNEEKNIRRNALYTDKMVDKLLEEINTIPSVLINSAKKFPTNQCLGSRYPTGKKKTIKDPNDPKKKIEIEIISDYKWESYSEVWDIVKFFGKGLIQIGLKPKDFVGIYSKNRREWLLSLYGTYSQTMVNVAIYDTFGPEVLRFCCEDAKIGAVVSEKSNLQKILSACEKKRIEVLKIVIVMGDYDEETEKKFSNVGIKLYTFDAVVQLGKESDEKCELSLPKPDDLATVMYTSGSTGDPKGVMLNHSNIIATISSVLLTLEIPGSGPIGTNDVYLSYLPLAHIFERVSCAAILFVGGKIGFYSGDPRKLIEDLSELKPTLMTVVPRVITSIKEKIQALVSSGSKLKQKIFKRGYEKQSEAVTNGKRNSIWDILVFNKIKKKLGGKVRLLLSGGAPLTEELWEFSKVAFGAKVLQGYALTETSAAASITNLNDMTLSAGSIVPSVEIRLEDWEEGEYTREKNGCGEIWIRGPSVFVGYYNNEEKTKEDLDSDGWFHTGDIGFFTEEGNLKIVDRKKNIFKLANGEYIPTEKIENTYNSSDLISQIFIHGESTKNHLIAILVPVEFKVVEWCNENDKKFTSLKEFFENEEFYRAYEKLINEDMARVAKTGNLKGPEVPKKIIITTTAWNPENDLTTPTMKIKRQALKKKFEKEIKEAYEEIESSEKK